MPAEKKPHEIIGTHTDMIRGILKGYRAVKEKMGWDDYAAKISGDSREIITFIFSELRRNGYFNPRVKDDQVVVDYVCYSMFSRSETQTPCLLCERECSLKEWTGLFKKDSAGAESKRCWE